MENLGYHNAGVAGKIQGNLLGTSRFMGEIEFFLESRCKFSEELLQLWDASSREGSEEPESASDDSQIADDGGCDPGILDFYGDGRSVFQMRAMHLPDRGGADRDRIKVLEVTFQGRGQFVLDDLANVSKREWGDVIVKRSQCFSSVGAQYVVTKRGELSDLYEGSSKLA